MGNHIIHCTALYFLARHRRIGPADACKDHPEIIIYLSTCRNGRPWVAGVDLLLDSNCRRYALNQFDIRLGHSSQELACIR